MRKLFSIAVIAILAGCDSGLSGEYGGKDCVYEKLVFKNDGAVYISAMGIEMPGKYKVDGDRVSVTSQNGKGLVFTRKSGVLELNLLGRKSVCTKL